MASSIEEAVSAVRNGGMVVVIDREDRENEGDLVMAAEHATPEKINFMLKNARGIICVPMTPERLGGLGIPPMVEDNTDRMGTGFTVTVDYREGTTTGVSASDRAKTIKALADSSSVPGDFNRPGHVFPLMASAGGLAERQGHTEAAVELVKMAGLAPVAVICEIMSADGSMAKGQELEEFAEKHGLPIISVPQLVRQRGIE
ncbi:3,4-dihydroxy-2-butanone-4-phosphate synthase [archaeon]